MANWWDTPSDESAVAESAPTLLDTATLEQQARQAQLAELLRPTPTSAEPSILSTLDSYRQAKAAAANPPPVIAAPAVPENANRSRTWGEVGSDVLAGLARGATGITQGMANLADLATLGGVSALTKAGGSLADSLLGGRGEGYTLQEANREIGQAIEGMESAPLRQQRQQFARTLQETGTQGGVSGALDKFVTGAKETLTNPMLLGQFATEQVPMIATLGLGTIGTAAKAEAAAKAAGLTGQAVRDAGIRAAERANILASGVLGSGFSSQQAADAILNAPIEDLFKNEQYVELAKTLGDRGARAELARQAGYPAAAIAGPLSALAGRITAPLETRAFLGQLPKGITPALVAGGKEGLEEALQEPSEQFGSNVGERFAGMDKSLWEGLPEAAGQAGAAGFLMGLGLGGVNVLQNTRLEGQQARATGESAAQHLDQLSLVGLSDADLDTTIQQTQQVIATPKLPPALRDRLTEAMGRLNGDQQARANGDALRQAFSEYAAATAPEALVDLPADEQSRVLQEAAFGTLFAPRTRNTLVGMSAPDKLNQLNDAEMAQASQVAVDAATLLARANQPELEPEIRSLLDAARAYSGELHQRRSAADLASEVTGPDGADRARALLDSVTQINGNPKQFISPEYQRATLADDQLPRLLERGQTLLRLDADPAVPFNLAAPQRAALTTALGHLRAEQANRQTEGWPQRNQTLSQVENPKVKEVEAALTRKDVSTWLNAKSRGPQWLPALQGALDQADARIAYRQQIGATEADDYQRLVANRALLRQKIETLTAQAEQARKKAFDEDWRFAPGKASANEVTDDQGREWVRNKAGQWVPRSADQQRIHDLALQLDAQNRQQAAQSDVAPDWQQRQQAILDRETAFREQQQQASEERRFQQDQQRLEQQRQQGIRRAQLAAQMGLSPDELLQLSEVNTLRARAGLPSLTAAEFKAVRSTLQGSQPDGTPAIPSRPLGQLGALQLGAAPDQRRLSAAAQLGPSQAPVVGQLPIQAEPTAPTPVSGSLAQSGYLDTQQQRRQAQQQVRGQQAFTDQARQGSLGALLGLRAPTPEELSAPATKTRLPVGTVLGESPPFAAPDLILPAGARPQPLTPRQAEIAQYQQVLAQAEAGNGAPNSARLLRREIARLQELERAEAAQPSGRLVLPDRPEFDAARVAANVAEIQRIRAQAEAEQRALSAVDQARIFRLDYDSAQQELARLLGTPPKAKPAPTPPTTPSPSPADLLARAANLGVVPPALTGAQGPLAVPQPGAPNTEPQGQPPAGQGAPVSADNPLIPSSTPPENRDAQERQAEAEALLKQEAKEKEALILQRLQDDEKWVGRTVEFVRNEYPVRAVVLRVENGRAYVRDGDVGTSVPLEQLTLSASQDVIPLRGVGEAALREAADSFRPGSRYFYIAEELTAQLEGDNPKISTEALMALRAMPAQELWSLLQTINQQVPDVSSSGDIRRAASRLITETLMNQEAPPSLPDDTDAIPALRPVWNAARDLWEQVQKRLPTESVTPSPTPESPNEPDNANREPSTEAGSAPGVRPGQGAGRGLALSAPRSPRRTVEALADAGRIVTIDEDAGLIEAVEEQVDPEDPSLVFTRLSVNRDRAQQLLAERDAALGLRFPGLEPGRLAEDLQIVPTYREAADPQRAADTETDDTADGNWRVSLAGEPERAHSVLIRAVRVDDIESQDQTLYAPAGPVYLGRGKNERDLESLVLYRVGEDATLYDFLDAIEQANARLVVRASAERNQATLDRYFTTADTRAPVWVAKDADGVVVDWSISQEGLQRRQSDTGATLERMTKQDWQSRQQDTPIFEDIAQALERFNRQEVDAGLVTAIKAELALWQKNSAEIPEYMPGGRYHVGVQKGLVELEKRLAEAQDTLAEITLQTPLTAPDGYQFKAEKTADSRWYWFYSQAPNARKWKTMGTRVSGSAPQNALNYLQGIIQQDHQAAEVGSGAASTQPIKLGDGTVAADVLAQMTQDLQDALTFSAAQQKPLTEAELKAYRYQDLTAERGAVETKGVGKNSGSYYRTLETKALDSNGVEHVYTVKARYDLTTTSTTPVTVEQNGKTELGKIVTDLQEALSLPASYWPFAMDVVKSYHRYSENTETPDFIVKGKVSNRLDRFRDSPEYQKINSLAFRIAQHIHELQAGHKASKNRGLISVDRNFASLVNDLAKKNNIKDDNQAFVLWRHYQEWIKNNKEPVPAPRSAPTPAPAESVAQESPLGPLDEALVQRWEATLKGQRREKDPQAVIAAAQKQLQEQITGWNTVRAESDKALQDAGTRPDGKPRQVANAALMKRSKNLADGADKLFQEIQDTRAFIAATERRYGLTQQPAAAPAGPVTRSAGAIQKVVTAAGTEIDARFEIVELADLITSDDARFPKELQPRDRTRVASAEQVALMAARLDPLLLADSRLASDGAPIVGPDNVVESGNGRTLALRDVYARGQLKEKAADYRAMLADHGFEVANMKAPVLIRRRVTEMSSAQRKTFTEEANARNIMGMSPAERAMVHASRLTPSLLDLYRGGDLATLANTDFVRGFMADVALNESAEMMDNEGRLNQEGVRRIESAILARAYPNADLLGTLLESTDNNIKAIGGALLDSAPGMVQLKSRIEKNLTPAELDITQSIVEAAQLVAKARRENLTLTDLLSQTDMFGGNIAPRTKQIVQLFFSDTDLKRQVSRDKIGYILNTYASLAKAIQSSDPLFPDAPIPTVNDLIKALEEKHRAFTGTGQQPSLLGGNPPGAIRPPSEPDVRRPSPGPASEATGKAESGEGQSTAGGQSDEAALGAIFDQELEKAFANVPSSRESVEPGVESRPTENGVGQDHVQPGRPGTAGGSGRAGRGAGQSGTLEQSSTGVSNPTAAVPGTRGARRVRRQDGTARTSERVPGSDDAGRGGQPGSERIQSTSGGRRRPISPATAPDAGVAPTAGQKAASATQEAVAGLKSTMDGLAALFGGHGKLSSGVTFDETTYQKAIPFFREAVQHFAQAAQDAREAIRLLIQAMMAGGYNKEVIANMKPYAIRFVQDVQTGQIDLTPPAEKPTPHQPKSEPEPEVIQPERLDFAAKQAAQRQAESTPVKVRDLDNIRATLPFLLPEQQEDVFKAEQRFDSFNGILYTNATGTGKTFTGLGIIKRMVKQGQRNILIVVPTQQKVTDWIEDGSLLGLDIAALPDTQTGGTGPVITTYANFRDNDGLSRRDWDLIVYDESHYLMSNQASTQTANLGRHNQLTLRPSGITQRARTLLEPAERTRLEQIEARAKNSVAGVAVLSREEQAEYNRLEQRARDLADQLREKPKPKVVFLSATPFAYHQNIDYAEGLLFDWGPEPVSRGYNTPTARQNFLITHFGYRMRTGRLTEPEADVDLDLMERRFHEWLKSAGAVSGRKLTIDQDYSRDFVEITDQIGPEIDRGINILYGYSPEGRERKNGEEVNKFPELSRELNNIFDYFAKTRLLETIKAREATVRAQQHIALGRKVVVFHDYIEANVIHPFQFIRKNGNDKQTKKWNNEIDRFNQEFPDLVHLKLHGLESTIHTFRRAFHGRVVFFNGRESKKARAEAIRQFNQDDSNVDVIVVQRDAGKEGISLHDVSGNRQRALIDLGLPTAPTEAIQTEGRIYRYGNRSDAIIEYLKTNTQYEEHIFGSRVATRSRTAENLAMGNAARNLQRAFVDAYLNSTSDAPRAGQGQGGKTSDARADTGDPFDNAISFYFSNRRKTARDKSAEGIDYFATPEPLGLKMVEWAGLQAGESALEPSAGHGAIARFFPEDTRNTYIEPSRELMTLLEVNARGNVRNETFENLHVNNKYDAIIMNPPFGSGGNTAIAHLEKAATHLRDGGRIVALLPEGSTANKRLEQFLSGARTVEPLIVHPTLGPLYRGDTIIFNGFGTKDKIVLRGIIDNGAAVYLYGEGETKDQARNSVAVESVEPTGQRSATGAANGLYRVADIGLPTVVFNRAGTAVKTHIVVLEKHLNPNDAPADLGRSDISSDAIKDFFEAIRHRSLPPRMAVTQPALPTAREIMADVDTDSMPAAANALLDRAQRNPGEFADWLTTKNGRQVFTEEKAVELVSIANPLLADLTAQERAMLIIMGRYGENGVAINPAANKLYSKGLATLGRAGMALNADGRMALQRYKALSGPLLRLLQTSAPPAETPTKPTRSPATPPPPTAPTTTLHITTHAKKSKEQGKQVPWFVVTMDRRVDRDTYQQLASAAKTFGGYYSSYDKQGAIPGFQFASQADAEAFQAKIGSATTPTAPVPASQAENRVAPPTPPQRFAIATPTAQDARDAEYLAAVERGDLETAQRMVDEAAREAGYDIGPVYHGTVNGKWTVFRNKTTTSVFGKEGYFFSFMREVAEQHARKAMIEKGKQGNGRIITAYLRNPESIGPNRLTNGVVEYVVNNADQIKSADPVTYDDAGNVIPLSQRFNRTQQDIRFAQGATPASVRASLEAIAGDRIIQDLIDAGSLVLVATQQDAVRRSQGRIQIPPGQRVGGAVDPETGTVYLIAEHIRPADVAGLLRHEVAVHQRRLGLDQPKPRALRLAMALLRLTPARQWMGETTFAGVLAQMERMRKAGNVRVVAAFEHALKAMKALNQDVNNPQLVAEEALAYLVGDQANADLPLFRRIMAAVRTFLTRAGFKLELTTDDLVALAQTALETAAQREVRAGAITKGVLGRNEEDAEAARQYAEVVARYTHPDGSKKAGWLKAPNGQPTKLNERQWVQVRTPNFIAWFGDWEYVAHQQAIDAIFPVEAVALSGKSLQEINRNVLNYVDSRYLHGEARQFENLETHDQIMVSKTALRKAMSGHAGEQKMWAATVVPDLLRVAHKVFTTNDNKGRPDIKAYHYYVAPVKIDGKIYYAKLVVRELTDGHKFYDHELSEVSEGAGQHGAASTTLGAQPSPPTLDHIVHHGWEKFNGNTSRVVDAHGEPLVVWHGTASGDFSAFDANKNRTILNRKYQGNGFSFTSNPAIADDYSTAARNQTISRTAFLGGIRLRYPLLYRFAKDLIDKGYEQAWAQPDRIMGLANRYGVDINDIGDLAEYVEGSASARNETGNLFGGVQSLPEWVHNTAARLGINSPSPSLIPAFLSLKNPLVTNDQGKARHAKAQGYDGLIYSGEGTVRGEPEYIAFSPTQIKSAIANTGAFSPVNPDIRYAVAGERAATANQSLLQQANPQRFAIAIAPGTPPQMTLPPMTRIEVLRRAIQDRFLRFKTLQDWLKKTGINLTPDADVYGEEERSVKRFAAQAQDFRDQTLTPLVQAAGQAGYAVTGGDFIAALMDGQPLPARFKPSIPEYLIAQHAAERNRAIAKINPRYANPDQPGSGLTDAEAATILARYRALPNFAAFEKMAEQFRAIAEGTKKLLLDAGILNAETVAAWDKAYQHYVPLKGGPDDAPAKQGSGPGNSVIARQRRAMGHDLRAENVLENIFRDRERALFNIEKNKVGQALKQFVEQANNPAIGTVGQPEKHATLIQGWLHEVWIEGRPLGAYQSYNDAKAAIAADSAATGRPVAQYGVRHKAVDPSVVYMTRPLLAENEAGVYINGELVRIQLNDEAAARAYNALGVDGAGGLLKVARSFNTFLSKAYTGYNPEFLLVNMARDLTAGTINLTGKYGAGFAAQALKHYVGSFREAWRFARDKGEHAWLDRYRTAGGSTGASYLSDLERLGGDIERTFEDAQGAVATWKAGKPGAAVRVLSADVVRKVFGLIEAFNQAGENALRIATFRTVIEQGGTEAEAASAAANVTVNFNRRGEMTYPLGALYLFFNPNVQGTQVLLDTLLNSPHKRQAQAAAAGMVALAFLLANLARGGDDEDEERWRRIPGYTKDRNLILQLGEKQITVPLPYGYGMFWALGNVLSDLAHGADDGKAGVRLASALFEHFSPLGNPLLGETADIKNLAELMPTLLRMPTDIMINRGGLGSPIMPEVMPWNPGQPDSARRWRETTGGLMDRVTTGLNKLAGGSAYESSGALTDISPETLRYLWRGLTGGAGQFVSDTFGLGMTLAQGATPELRETPGLRKFVRVETVQNARTLFSDQANQIREAVGAFNAAKRAQDAAGMFDLVREKAALIRLGSVLEQFQGLIKTRRQLHDLIQASEMPLPQKRLQLKMIEQEESKLYGLFSQIFRHSLH